MNTKGEKTKERIDLGLGTLLSALEPEPEREVSIELSTAGATPEPSAWTLGGSEVATKGEFDLLADERKWTEIIRRAEPRLMDKADVEARLWWVRGHLGAFSMPVSYLAAPLESLCSDIAGKELSAQDTALLKETGLLTLGRLEDVGEKGIADGLRVVLESVGVQQPRGVGRRHRVGTSSFRAYHLEDATSSVQSVPVPVVPPKSTAATSPRARLMWASGCAVVVVTLLLLDQLYPQLRSPTKGVASETFLQVPHAIELSRPMLERREPGGRLGALFYSLEEGKATSSQKSVESSPTLPMETLPERVAKALDDPTKSSGEKPTPAPQDDSLKRETVRTDGPVEGAEFRNRIDSERPRPSRSRREELRGGPPQAVLPGTAPEGFEPQKTYRVLSRTSVLSAPSFGGRVIGTLDRGDRVLVEGKLGRWLRLRSKKGRGGYVIAADVEEIPDL